MAPVQAFTRSLIGEPGVINETTEIINIRIKSNAGKVFNSRNYYDGALSFFR